MEVADANCAQPGSQPFGHLPDGTPVSAYTITDSHRVELTVLDFGATIQSVRVPGPSGSVNIALGHSEISGYLGDADAYLGGLIGRYANRIADATFELDGVTHRLAANDDGACHHGGPVGFSRSMWTVESVSPETITLSLTSPHGDQGFPGELTVTATYTVTGAVVVLEIAASTDRPTVFGPTSHVYWNLTGEGRGAVDAHQLEISADRFLPVSPAGIPTGGLLPVAETPLDFTRPVPLGDRMRADHPQIHRGIDHSFDVVGQGLRPMAALTDPASGRGLELFSDLPAVQVYTSNFFDGSKAGTSGIRYRQGDGIALEPQFHPDTPNHPELGDSVILPGQPRSYRMEWHLLQA